MNIRARKKKKGILGFTATETMVTMAIIGILSSMLLPAVVNARRMTERRVTYLQYREYLMAVATSFSETTHLDQPLLVGLDFSESSVVFEDIEVYYNEMVESTYFDGFAYPEMRYFKNLDFSYTEFDDRWMREIVPTPVLTSLILDSTKVTDEGLRWLYEFQEDEDSGTNIWYPLPRKTLRYLSVVSCPGVSDEMVERIRRKLPKCMVVKDLGAEGFVHALEQENTFVLTIDQGSEYGSSSGATDGFTSSASGTTDGSDPGSMHTRQNNAPY